MVSGWPTKFSATWHNTKSSTDSTEIENHAKKSRAKERSVSFNSFTFYKVKG